jgi:hypothetical protein
MQEPVRAKLEDGAEVTVDRAYAENHGLKVLDDKRAVGRDGRAMAAKPPVDLRGKELDEALRAADLPTGGTAQEKRDRLAEHQSSTAFRGGNNEEEGR